ncbi:PREDICTED: interferon-induced very large GTPase 1-like, partial [Ficedula albicollis]|uniref:interferon-induced very large GTPase 1-like n=1 Tax=Ficedula albicollis TaxID=59894 RepID=UPI0007AD7E7D
LETVKAWEVTVDERKLHMLMEVKDDLSAKTKNHRVWTNVCLSDRALQDFLVNTVRSCQESPPENTPSIKVILRSLLDPYIYSVKDFPEASSIMQWIFQNEHPLPRSPKISELEELIKTLQEMKEHIYAVTYAPGSSASAVHEAKIKATLTSSLAIYSLLQSLQERAEKDMELLVLLIVTSTGYQVESSTFQHLLGHPDIQYMAKEMQEAHEEYVNLKDLTEKENIATGRSSKTITIELKNRNEAELVDQLTKIIRDFLEGSNPCISLDACVDKARQHGFIVDADQPTCVTAKAKAKELVDLLKKEKLSEIKSQLLPLQGKLWCQWCKKDKELTRLQEKGNKSIEHHRSQIEYEKKAIRRKQLEQAFPLNPLMKSFLGFLQAQPADTRKYFLQWMKVFMDELSCGRLEELRRDYHELWTKILSGKKNKKNPKVNDPLLTRLDAVSDEINDSSIGLEHLLREVGQIYEALELTNTKGDILAKLPEIAAQLMVSGYPVELMDGDASYLPLRWVGAIFDSLIERLGDKRVFVLSVLGIQSTGKSTLLNAMFGLQFNVSAGRCTRGAFMQLIPVGEELQQDLGFDFVLVVDTEGLRAIEMANKQSLKHDNELATFVIGVGNLTVINIFGENPAEMQDVLQIAVQAFLRMKKVNLSPSCLFVHQNVGEATAKEQNMEGQRCLQEKLDEMTVVAAQQEFCDVSSFSDVIGFDVKTHIHYFAHLWEGNPPMAPPNPTYSQNVQQLKSKILQAAKQHSQRGILKLSTLKDRIGDLWNGDYSRNFIHEILNEVQKGVNSVHNEKWTFNREYSMDLSLYLCKMAAERFKAMHNEFQKANDPVIYLSSKREDFFQCFQISCQGATSVITIVVFLCEKIEPALREAVFEKTAKDIAEDMKSKFPDFRGNRANLEVCILRYLAEQENFAYFKQYLTSPKQFFQSYIEKQVKSHCLDESRRLRMFLHSCLESFYGNILSAVSLSTQIVKDRKDREDKISLWLDEFCGELAEVINLPRSDLKGIEHQEVTDIEFLSSAMAKGLAAVKDRIKAEFTDADLSSFSRQPHTILAEHFSGCWEQCPFCGAVCTNTMRDHDGDHQLVFHRPQALRGYTWWVYSHDRWHDTHELSIDICSSYVASNCSFGVNEHHYIPYKTYRKAGPPFSTWNILPDSSMQAYWKWFVSHFRTELEAFCKGKFQGRGVIPEAWRRITKQEALSELEQR